MKGRFVLLLLATGLFACAAEEPGAEITVDTLPGGTVVVHNPDGGVWKERAGWRLVEDLRLGSSMGEGPETFADIRDLEVDEYGRIYVLNRGLYNVQVFDADGEHVRTLGREGEGPGEFREPYGMTWDPQGNLWVFDLRNARYTLFDTTGAWVDTRLRPVSSYGVRWEALFDDAGRLLEPGRVREGEESRAAVIVRDPESMAVLDTVRFEDPYSERMLEAFQFERDGGQLWMGVPFSPGLHRAIRPDGTVWVGFSDEYRISRSTLRGDTLLIIEKDHEPRPVSETEFEEALERFDARNVPRSQVDLGRIPRVHPAYDFFMVGQDGLWVAVPDDPDSTGTLFDVFDRAGRYLGEVRSPVEFQPYGPWVVGRDQIHALIVDEFDVPYVVRLRIERGGD